MLPIVLVELFSEARTLLAIGRASAVALEEGAAAGLTYASENVSATSVASIIMKKYSGLKKSTSIPDKTIESEDSFFFIATRAYFKTLDKGFPAAVITEDIQDKLTLSALLSPIFAESVPDVVHKTTAYITALNTEVLNLDPERLTAIGRALDQAVDQPVDIRFLQNYLNDSTNIQRLTNSLSKLGFNKELLTIMIEKLASDKPLTSGLTHIYDQFDEGRKVLAADTWVGLMRGALIQQASLTPVIAPRTHKGAIGFVVGSLMTHSSHDAAILASSQNFPKLVSSITNAHIRNQEEASLRFMGWTLNAGSRKLEPPTGKDYFSNISGHKITSQQLAAFADELWAQNIT
jgi:hypothetical protein